MAEQFYTILTNIGKAKIANALPTGQKVDLIKMKIGDSNGTYYNPSETQTELVHSVYECNITSVEVDENNPNWITITSAIPSDVGGFSIREVGLFDDTNSLIAIGKYPETYKPIASDGSTKELYIKMTLEITNASSVELKIDPTVIIATKKDIANVIEKFDKQLKDTMCKSIEELKKVTIKYDKQTVNVLSFYENESQGGGIFYWDANCDKKNHNGGVIIDNTHKETVGSQAWYNPSNTGKGCWIRQYNGVVESSYFGAKNDLTSDSSYALQSAINYCARNHTSSQIDAKNHVEPLHIIQGNYLIKNTLTINASGHNIYGDGDSTTLFGDSTSLKENSAIIDSIETKEGESRYLLIEKMKFVATSDVNSITQDGFVPKLMGIRSRGNSHTTKSPLSRFSDLSFYGFLKGIEWGWGWLAEFRNCSFVGPTSANKQGVGIYINASGANDNTLPAPTNFNALTIKRCNFQYLDTGVKAFYGRNLTINDCSFELINIGAILYRLQGAMFTGNYLEKVSNYGIGIGAIASSSGEALSTSYSTSNIICEGNTLQDACNNGFFRLSGCHKVRIKNNHQTGIDTATLENNTSIESHTITVSDSSNGLFYIIDSEIEYWKEYGLSKIKDYTTSSVFTDLLYNKVNNINSLMGAIVSTGSKTDDKLGFLGDYIAFSDGTLICKADNLSIPINSNKDFNYPKNFTTDVRPFINGSFNAENAVFTTEIHSSYFKLKATGGTTGDINFGYFAIGRWK